jgi:hypothetical protein
MEGREGTVKAKHKHNTLKKDLENIASMHATFPWTVPIDFLGHQ